ncbi:proteasome subunit alpha type-5 isoform X1 [Manihot esculenta]|uniref:Proteasome alpha-type subunits domain-containing protein n=2 Tax=Manihot esculenta TaxID=3983 RepID=A0A2C9W2R9_MANES|nr:proteasome subunit alpha type-5 isoform X1 [Manihot esculenta]XP_043812074.1 proteasome subunit alpha type-5 isoform X1 [Manihot esculenta]OAY53277.1 hypothetical protein MANES_04G150800v8 [Manihot esculenta]
MLLFKQLIKTLSIWYMYCLETDTRHSCGVQLVTAIISSQFSQEPTSVEKVMEIDEHIGCAMSGYADAHARVETQNHRFAFGEPMTVESATQAICDLALRFGEGDEESMDITLQEGETIALSIMKQVMEEKVTPNNVDIARVAPTYHLYTPAEVESVISRL